MPKVGGKHFAYSAYPKLPLKGRKAAKSYAKKNADVGRSRRDAVSERVERHNG